MLVRLQEGRIAAGVWLSPPAAVLDRFLLTVARGASLRLTPPEALLALQSMPGRLWVGHLCQRRLQGHSQRLEAILLAQLAQGMASRRRENQNFSSGPSQDLSFWPKIIKFHSKQIGRGFPARNGLGM